MISSLPIQVVHSDIGSDDVIINGDNAAVVDFTRSRQRFLFSVSAALTGTLCMPSLFTSTLTACARARELWSDPPMEQH